MCQPISGTDKLTTTTTKQIITASVIGALILGELLLILRQEKPQPSLQNQVRHPKFEADSVALDRRAWIEAREDFPGAADNEIADYQARRKQRLMEDFKKIVETESFNEAHAIYSYESDSVINAYRFRLKAHLLAHPEKPVDKGERVRLAPMLVESVTLSKQLYGRYIIQAKLRNNTSRTIDAIKVRWYLYNNFGEMVSGYDEKGIAQTITQPRQKAEFTWKSFAEGAKQVSLEVTSVHFSNDKTWTLKEFD